MSQPQAKRWFEISNVSEQSADVYLYDYIGSYGVTAAAFLSQINAIKAPTINLHINSGGGSVFDGFAIYNGLVAHPAKVKVSIDGLAASIASVIAMAGDEIEIAANGFVMIHRAGSELFGNAETLRAEANLLEQLDHSIAGVYASRSGGNKEAIFKAMQAETWMNSETALNEGFATAVTPSKTPEARARVNLSKFKNPPAELTSAPIDAAPQIEPMPTENKTPEPVAAVTVPAVAATPAEPVAAIVPPAVETITAEASMTAVRTAVEAAHAAHRVEVAALRENFAAKLNDISAKLKQAEGMSAAKLGVPPVAFVASTDEKKDILAEYRALSGDARTAFYTKHQDEIWQARTAE